MSRNSLTAAAAAATAAIAILTGCATTHHTTVAALKRDNGNLAMLRPGMILVIRQVQ